MCVGGGWEEEGEEDSYERTLFTIRDWPPPPPPKPPSPPLFFINYRTPLLLIARCDHLEGLMVHGLDNGSARRLLGHAGLFLPKTYLHSRGWSAQGLVKVTWRGFVDIDCYRQTITSSPLLATFSSSSSFSSAKDLLPVTWSWLCCQGFGPVTAELFLQDDRHSMLMKLTTPFWQFCW